MARVLRDSSGRPAGGSPFSRGRKSRRGASARPGKSRGRISVSAPTGRKVK